MLKKNILILFSLILLALFSMTSSAEFTEDFTAYTQFSNVDACSSAILQDFIVLTNTGAFVSGYTISITGNGAIYSALSETFIILKPGETKSINNIVSLPSNKEEKLNFDIAIETNMGLKKIIFQKINVIKCNNNQMTFLNGNSFTNEPCSITRYDLELTNKGLSNELYNLDVEGLPSEYVSFSHNPVLLTSQDKVHIIALINMPCHEYGIFEPSFTSIAKESGFKVKLPFFLEIKRDYNYSISFGNYKFMNHQSISDFSKTQTHFCEGVKSAIPVKLSNEVIIANTYLVSENSDQSWINVDTDSVQTLGNSDNYFNIVLNPKKGDEGNYSIPLYVKSKRGDLVFDKSINVVVEDCTSFSLNTISYDKTCCGDNVYKLNVTNHGTKANLIFLDGNVNFSSPNIALAPGQSKNIEMNIFVPCNESGVKTFNINATVDGHSEFEETSFIVDFVDKETCHMLAFDKNSETVFYEFDERSLTISSFAVESSNYELYLSAPQWVVLNETNIYLENGEKQILNLHYYAPSASVPGVYKIYISAKADTGHIYKQMLSLTLREKTWKDSTLEYLDHNKGIVLFALFLLIFIIFLILFLIKNMPDSKEKPIEKKVENKNKISKKADKKEKPVKTEKKKKFPWEWLIIFLLLILVLVGVYLAYDGSSETDVVNETQDNFTLMNQTDYNYSITNQSIANQTNVTIEPIVTEETNQTNFFQQTWDNFIIWITPVKTNETQVKVNESINELVNETLEEEVIEEEEEVVYELPYEEQLYQYVVSNNLTSSFQYQSWYKNEVYTINLTPRFVDPDSDDVLEFTSTQPRNMGVEIVKGVVYLTPANDWTGVDYITFKATDTYGAQVITPEIALIVRDRYGSSLIEIWDDILNFLKNNSMYFLFGAIILIILILILSTGSVEEKK